MTQELRTVEVFDGKQWVQKRLIEIRKGDLFRLFESDGTQVFCNGRCEWFARGDAFMNRDGPVVEVL